MNTEELFVKLGWKLDPDKRMAPRTDILHSVLVILFGVFILIPALPLRYLGVIVGYLWRAFSAGFRSAQKGGAHDKWMHL